MTWAGPSVVERGQCVGARDAISPARLVMARDVSHVTQERVWLDVYGTACGSERFALAHERQRVKRTSVNRLFARIPRIHLSSPSTGQWASGLS